MSSERHHVAPAFETELTSPMATLCRPLGVTLSFVSVQRTLLSTSVHIQHPQALFILKQHKQREWRCMKRTQSPVFAAIVSQKTRRVTRLGGTSQTRRAKRTK